MSGGAPLVVALQQLSGTAVAHSAAATVLDDRSGRVAALSSAVQLCAQLLTCDTAISARHGRTIVLSSSSSEQRYAISRVQAVHAPTAFAL